jgi:hypothetical protein
MIAFIDLLLRHLDQLAINDGEVEGDCAPCGMQD